LTNFSQKIIFANQAFLEAMTLTRENVIGTTPQALGLTLEKIIDHQNNDFKIFPPEQKNLITAIQQVDINGKTHLLYHWHTVHASDDHQHAYGNISGWLDITEHE